MARIFFLKAIELTYRSDTCEFKRNYMLLTSLKSENNNFKFDNTTMVGLSKFKKNF